MNKDSFYNPMNISTGLPLLPFTNQVGGHTSIFRFSKRTICKPASQKEQEVYNYLESHHPELLPFLSQYLGVLNVTYNNSSRQDKQLLPEVIFEKNEKLLNDWKNIYYNSVDELTTPSPSSDILEKDFQQWSPNEDECNSRFKAFRKRVLYEALNPNALKERIKIVDAWNKENGIEKMSISSKRPSIITSTTSAPQSPRLLAALSRNIEHIESSRSNSLTVVPSLSNKDETKVTYCSSPLVTSHNNSIEVVSSPQQQSPQQQQSAARWQPRRAPTNPWSQQVYERDRQKLLQLAAGEERDDVVKQFILLEDLTDEVIYPCVLDLKMGTRQHGVYANEEKVQSQTEKCNNSTSALMGVRVCGMQVYKQEEFVFYDKYHGRTLTPAKFKETLVEYLNGKVMDQIPILTRKLSRLSKIIASLKGYRFYGSSLLVIYDASEKNNKIDVRMIDFAKSVTPDQDSSTFTCPPERPNDPDHGYLLGLQSLIDCFNTIYHEHAQ